MLIVNNKSLFRYKVTNNPAILNYLSLFFVTLHPNNNINYVVNFTFSYSDHQ